MRMYRATQKWCLGASALVIAGISGTASAEAPPAGASQPSALEEVVVTAQRREEKLQETPLSISAISADEMKLRGIENVNDLAAQAPNVFARPNPGAAGIATIGIRGSVSGQPAIWMDTPIGVYVDGVYLGKSQGGVLDVVDAERVEVLRGPQGTLFGRNTEGGAINFVSHQPSGEMRGSAEAQGGNFNHSIGRLSFDLPKWGILSTTFAGRYEEMDGWAKNDTGPQDLGALKKTAFRGVARLDFTDDFAISYTYDYSDAHNTPTVTSLYALSGWKVGLPPAGSQGTFPTTFPVHIGTDIENAMRPYLESKRPDHVSTPAGVDMWEDTRNNANTVVADWKVNDTEELKYILAQRNADYNDQQSINGTPLAAISTYVLTGYPPPYDKYPLTWGMGAIYNRITQYEQTSNELQWLGDHDTFHYVVGLYDFQDRGKTRDPQNFSMFGQAPLEVEYATNTDAQAIYAQADWEFVDNWTGTLGIRYTEETRSGYTHQWLTNGYKGDFVTDNPATCAAARQSCLPKTNYSADFTGTTPMAALAYKFSDDLNFFFRAARGFKSGGFSQELINPAVVKPYKPEYSWAYELGAKSTLWDGRATLNATVFYTQLTDLQTTILIEGTTQSILNNAGKGTREGFELEGRVRVADGWTAYLNYGYLHATFGEYMDNKLNNPDKGTVIDTGSNRVPGYAPENTLSVGFDGRLLQTDMGALRLLVDYSYMDKYYLYAANKSLESQKAGGSFWTGTDGVPASDQINARLLWSDLPLGGGKLDLSLFVKNLTDSDKMVQGIDFSMFRTANWQDPRTFMFTANYKW